MFRKYLKMELWIKTLLFGTKIVYLLFSDILDIFVITVLSPSRSPITPIFEHNLSILNLQSNESLYNCHRFYLKFFADGQTAIPYLYNTLLYMLCLWSKKNIFFQRLFVFLFLIFQLSKVGILSKL